jgi:PEP-CTERM/exosortase A-associated glycosyltransferase
MLRPPLSELPRPALSTASSLGNPFTLRILHILDHSVPLHSGYTFRTLAILREQRKRGWETFHLTSPKHTAPCADEEEVDGLHFFRTHLEATALTQKPPLRELSLMRATQLRLAEVVRRIQPDIIHAHSPVLNAIPALRASRSAGIPVVYEVRAFWEDAAVDHGTHAEWGLRYRLSRALETYALRRVDHVFTICEGLRRDIVQRGLAPASVTVIPNGVDPEAFTLGGAPDEALKASLGLAGATIIGFIGSFYAYEGLDLLLAAVPQLLRDVPNARVLLVGGGPKDADLKAQAHRMGIADKVVFTGRVPHQEVGRYYDLVDILAYPRHSMRLTELVTPLKPLEAMAQGRLLVASDVGGHRELIEDGRTGVLFKAGSAESLATALRDLMRNRDIWPKMRAAGRSYVENERNWPGIVARYQPVYERLTRDAPRGRS